MSKDAPIFSPTDLPVTARVAIVAARFNADMVEKLLDGCKRRLAEAEITGDRLELYRVPGAFELPVAAAALAKSKKFAAVICLGCVIRGDTPHFDFVAGECARGIARVSLDHVLPIIFGVLTTNTVEQTLERLGGTHGHAGERAADAAMEMIGVMGKMSAE
jgi:6,7-dimethyl-8-ribityllumazine synthase